MADDLIGGSTPGMVAIALRAAFRLARLSPRFDPSATPALMSISPVIPNVLTQSRSEPFKPRCHPERSRRTSPTCVTCPAFVRSLDFARDDIAMLWICSNDYYQPSEEGTLR